METAGTPGHPDATPPTQRKIMFSAASSEARRWIRVKKGAAAAVTVTADPNDNVTSDGAGTTSVFDLANRLSTVTNPAGVATSYAFDGDGLRLTRRSTAPTGQTPEQAVDFTWDPTFDVAQLATERTGATVLRTYLRGIDTVGYTTSAGGTAVSYAYGHDRMGSVTDVLDPAGSQVWKYEYDQYGVRTPTAVGAPPANPIGYTGELTDTNGNVYLRAREYDPP